MPLKTTLPPDQAWQPYEPSADQPFDRRAAAHLYRRAGFAANFTTLDAAVKAGPAATVKSMLASGDGQQHFDAEMEQMVQSVLAGNNPEALASWWLYRMRHTPSPLLEKTTLFWHGHFATSATKVREASLMLRQNELLRKHALGSFTSMLQGIARDPAMLIYLDSVTNRKTHPNENFAREVMELFCLGVGKYSEKDIQELARCYTGWEIQHGEFKFNQYQHDYGQKSMFGRSGQWDGDDGIREILQQPAAAEFLCMKLIRYFVADELEISDELLAPLAKLMREHDYTTGSVVQTILSSRLFFSLQIRGAKVRSPVELCIGLLRSLDATVNTYALVDHLRSMGQLPLFPPNVKGWNGGREWINASTILARANRTRQMLDGNEVQFGGVPLEAYLRRFDLGDSRTIVAGLCELLLPVDPPIEVREQLATALEAGGAPREQRLRQCVHAIVSLPECQIG
jgi:uncharacterized protein (DUF1800 family)